MQVKKNIFIKTIANLALSIFAGFIFQATAFAEVDPPSRVARLSYFDGSVTFAPATSDDWAYAYLNRPLTTGDRLWVDQGGRSELQLGSTSLRLNSQTSLDLMALDDTNTQIKLTQGTLNVRVRDLFNDESFEVDTPNLAFSIKSPGEYRIDVDPTYNTTTISVRNGNGDAYGEGGGSFHINAKEQVRFGGTELIQARADNLAPADEFDRWVSDRNSRQDKSVSTKYVSREVIGYEDLDSHGTWRDEPGYGAVWVPRVTIVNWAPYRYGHWAWIAPWGWTWVDDAPWGFAPFHYGRWAWVRSSWAWVPGAVVRRPVYAPALVAFAGSNRGGVSWGISLSIGSPGVAWFPLAPGEAYRPAYGASPRYVTNVNNTVIVNKTVNVTKNVYINQNVNNAVTAVPASAFVRGQSVQKNSFAVRQDQLRNVNVNSTPALAPVKQSLLGEAKVAKSLPPREIQNRQVMATRSSGTPAAFRDTLAEKFARQNGTAPGAGAALKTENRAHENNAVSVVKPSNDSRGSENSQRGQNNNERATSSNNAPRPPSKNVEDFNRRNGENNSPKPVKNARDNEQSKERDVNKASEARPSNQLDRDNQKASIDAGSQRNNNIPRPPDQGGRRAVTNEENTKSQRDNRPNSASTESINNSRQVPINENATQDRRRQTNNSTTDTRSANQTERINDKGHNSEGVQRGSSVPRPVDQGERRVITTKEAPNIQQRENQQQPASRREDVNSQAKEIRRDQEINRQMKSRSEAESARHNQPRSDKNEDRSDDDKRGGGEDKQKNEQRGEGRRHGGN